MENSYENKTWPADKRAKDLLSRMSIHEKFGQIQGYCPSSWANDNLELNYPHGVGEVSFLIATEMQTKEQVAKEVRRIQEMIMKKSEHHIPALFHVETLCGGMFPEGTSFPTGIGRGATWNPKLEKQMGVVIRQQAYALGLRHAFSPVLDVTRDARFGRQGESYGEDPTLVSAMGVAAVQGLQNDGDLEHGLIACSKHFLGYHHSQGGVHPATANIPARVLREIYAKPFQAAITKAHLASAMNAYSSINGQPVAGSKELLTDLLRVDMGFDGIVVSDYTAISELHTRQHLCESLTDAGARCLKAGLDVELPCKNAYGDDLKELFLSGQLDIHILDAAVERVLITKFKSGLFENPFPFDETKLQTQFETVDGAVISKQMAKESLVLLKNDGVLPLTNAPKKIVVVGHHAKSKRTFFGGYTFVSMAESALGIENTAAGMEINTDMEDTSFRRSRVCYPGSNVEKEHPDTEALMDKICPHIYNLFDELTKRFPDSEIEYAYGYPYVGDDDSYHQEAMQVAKQSDLVIVTLGGKYGWGTTCTTGEGIDSSCINLPKTQELFLEKIAALNKPLIGIHFDGRPLSSNAADTHLNAIIQAWNPGEFGAEAIVSVLAGDYNPSGKLPVSVAYHAGQIPVSYNHDNGSGYHVGSNSAFKSYVDLPREPRYYFGYGLSYTTFLYRNLQLSKRELIENDTISIAVDIVNTGKQSGEEVVQLYVSDVFASMVRPNMELLGFTRVSLQPKELKTVTFVLHSSQLAFLDEEMIWAVEHGEYIIKVGSSSNQILLEDRIYVKNSFYIDQKERSFYTEVIL